MRDIHILKTNEPLARRLAESSHPVTRASLFPTFRELACFAALVGFDAGESKPLVGQTQSLVDGRIFGNSEQAIDIQYLIGLAGTRDQKILLDDPAQEERLVSLFEGYVNAGFQILALWMSETPSDPDGDKAILSALRKNGYLSAPEPADHALANVTF